MSPARQVSVTIENYLEAILDLTRAKGTARVRDIAAHVQVHKSTVTATLRTLAEKGLANYKPYELVTLTPKGKRIADALSRSHKTIEQFLSDLLLLPENVAKENACRMEHVIDKKVLSRFLMLADFVNSNPKLNKLFFSQFAAYVEKSKETSKQ